MIPLHCLTPKTSLVQKSGSYEPDLRISYTRGVIANFMSKRPTSRYRGNSGRSGANLSDTMKLADLKTPRLVQESGTSPIQAEL